MKEQESTEFVERDVLLPDRYRTIFHEAAKTIKTKGSKGITIKKNSLRKPQGDYDLITPAGTLGFTIQGAEEDVAKFWGKFADLSGLSSTIIIPGPQPFSDTDTGKYRPRVLKR